MIGAQGHQIIKRKNSSCFCLVQNLFCGVISAVPQIITVEYIFLGQGNPRITVSPLITGKPFLCAVGIGGAGNTGNISVPQTEQMADSVIRSFFIEYSCMNQLLCQSNKITIFFDSVHG